jgi:hypothetical protein
MRKPARRTILTSPGAPVNRTPAPLSAARVEPHPAGPKSNAWLLAWLTMSIPARASVPAFAGGAWNAKHVGLCEPAHLDAPPGANVP